MTNMSNSLGSADREMAIVEESIDYKINRLKETWVGLIQELIDKGTLGNSIDALTTISEAIADIATNSDKLILVVTAITGLIAYKKKNNISQFLTELLTFLTPAGGITKGAEAAADGVAGIQEALYGAATAEKVVEGETVGLSAAWKGLYGALGISSGALAGIVGILGAVVGATVLAIYKTKQANDELRKSAKRLGSEFSSAKDDISDYKKEIERLQSIIKDENSSYEDSLRARQDLLGIQDELIAKYGHEASSINLITQAIDGEVSALDRLTASEWRRTQNEFNNQDLKGWDSWNRAWAGVDTNTELMLKEMEGVTVKIEFAPPDKKVVDQLAELYHGKAEIIDPQAGRGVLTLSGSLEDIQNQIVQIQNTADSLDLSSTFKKSLALNYKDNQEVLDQYQEYYDQYIFYERVMKKGYADDYKDFSAAINRYNDAIINNKEDLAKEEFNNIKSAYKELTEQLDDDIANKVLTEEEAESIREWFLNLNPELKVEVDKEYIKDQINLALNISPKVELNENEQLYVDYKNAVEDAISKGIIDATSATDYIFNHFGEAAGKGLSSIAEYESDITKKAAMAKVQTTTWLNGLEKKTAEVTAEQYNLLDAFNEFDNLEDLTGFEALDNPTEEMTRAYELIKSTADSIPSINGDVKLLHDYVRDTVDEFEGLVSLNTKNAAQNYLNAAFGTEYDEKGFLKQNREDAENLEKAIENLNDEEKDYISTMVNAGTFGNDFTEVLKEQGLSTHTGEVETEKLDEALKSLIERYKELHPEVDGSSEDLNDWATYLTKALEKIGMSDSDFDTYVEVLKKTNPELADNQELAEKTALANQLFSNSVKDLQSNLDTYVEALSDTTKKTPEYNDAIVKLSDHLRNLTGINFSITDTEAFISDQKNLEDLKKAIEGDDEALHRLQETAAESIYIEVDDSDLQWLENRLNEISSEANISIPADINSDGLVDDFNALIDWLNTADLGSIEAQTYLNTNPFMQALQALAAQSEETANAIAAMFQNKGIDAQVTYTTVNMPDIGNPAKQIGTIPTNVAQLMNKNLSNGKLSKKYVNASANGIVYGTTPMQVPSISFNSTVGGKRVSPTYKQTPKHISAPSSSKKGGGGGGGGGNGGPSSDSENSANEQEDTYDELFDYFERRLDVLNNAAELLDKNLENVVGSMAKNTLLDAKGGILKEQMNNYEDALNMYQQKADEAFNKLPADIQARIKDGAVALTEFIGQGNEEVVEAMNDYKNWADKVDDVKQNLAELKETLRQLELQKFNNIVEDFTQQFDLRQSNGIDLIKDQIALLEEAGQVIGEAFYTTQKSETEKLLSLLSDEKNALTNQFNEAIRNGVEIGSDEYLEMVNALTDVDSKILEAKTSLEEFDNAILQLHVDMFERVQTTFSNYHDELEDIRSLIESADEDVATKDNAWTSTGLAQLGTLAQQYEMASYQVRQYDDEIALLNQQYLEGRYSATEYADRLADLMGKQRDAAQQTESIKDSMMELNKARVEIVVEGINEEIEAYEKLITAQKDTLSAEKDLHDYRKSIEESNKSITDIQKQLAAISNDDSQKARAQRAKLQQQLSEAQEALEEKEYSHSIETQQQALDDQLTAYKDSRNKEIEELQATLEDRELMISQSFEAVRANAEQIGITIRDTALTHGIEVSTALTDAWNAGSNAIGAYGAALNAGSSQFMTNITNVESGVYSLQDQANQTAIALANMYATNADGLITQLEQAKASESNMKAMTDALGQSMTSVLDRGYAIDSISKMFDSAATSAENLARSASNAASSIKSMYEAASNPTFPSTSQKTGPYTHQGGINTNSSKVAADEGGLVTVRDKNGNIVEITTKEKAKKKYGSKGLYGYASGYSSIPKNQLAWTQEKGQELIISPSDGSVLTRLNRGDTVFSAEQTRKLWELSKMNLPNMAGGILKDFKLPTSGLVTANTMQVGSLIEVNGNVNDSMDMLKIAAQEASKQIGSSFKQLNEGLHR